MFQLNINNKNKKSLQKYFQELETRVSKYFRRFLIDISEEYKSGVSENLDKIDEPEAKMAKENLDIAFVDYKKVPKKDLSKNKKEKFPIEQHYISVLTQALEVTADQKDINTTVIRVIPTARGKQEQSIFILMRFSPWHFETIPYLPNPDLGIIIFDKVSLDQNLAIKKRNESSLSKVQSLMKKNNIELMSHERIMQDLKGYDNLEYWTLRKEFGLDLRKQGIWSPALKKIDKDILNSVMKRNVKLRKILFDPTFKGYKNVDKDYKIIDEDEANQLIDFEKKIRK